MQVDNTNEFKTLFSRQNLFYSIDSCSDCEKHLDGLFDSFFVVAGTKKTKMQKNLKFVILLKIHDS